MVPGVCSMTSGINAKAISLQRSALNEFKTESDLVYAAHIPFFWKQMWLKKKVALPTSPERVAKTACGNINRRGFTWLGAQVMLQERGSVPRRTPGTDALPTCLAELGLGHCF